MDEEDFFSDDDLGNIPDDTILELEQYALSSTPMQNPQSLQQPLRKQAHNASSLIRTGGANKNLPWRPPQPTRPQIRSQALRAPPQIAPPASAPDPPSSDYGLDDEEVIDLDEPSMVIQPDAGMQNRQSSVQPGFQPEEASQSLSQAEMEAPYTAADAELGSQTFGRWQPPQPRYNAPGESSMDTSALKARIAQLEAERTRLQHAEHQAREEARQKQGEISIVRANQEKAMRQYETRIAQIQKVHADEATRQKAELEAQKKEREKTETNNRFLQHDLAQEAERTKRSTAAPKSRVATQMGTPRRNKRTAIGDGFDDDEVRLVSPTRSKERVKEQTPKLGAKRKRSANDSPVASLSFTQPVQLQHTDSEQTIVSFPETTAEGVIQRRDSRYDYLQLILNHRPHEGHARTVEQMAKYSFPSRPEHSLASIFIDKITYEANAGNDLPLMVCRVLLTLWSQCLDDKFFAPLYLVVHMLRSVLETELASTSSELLEEAIPLCVRSVDLVSVPIARASTNRTFAAKVDFDALDRLAEEIEVDEVLDFLHGLCQAATLSPESLDVFWRTMDVTWILLVLNKALPLDQIITVLQILITSARPTTFSVVSDDPESQANNERQTVDRLTNMLFEMPEVRKDEPPYDEEDILALRIEVLSVFWEMCHTDHGGQVLAMHRSVIGRLVRFLDSQVSKLYKVRPSLSVSSPAKDDQSIHGLIVQTVNTTVRILHHLLRTYGDNFVLGQKVGTVLGGYHKFLIGLTRVAFSEQLIFEAGIETEVSEAAHNILDQLLGPEEGEAVMKAIETPRGTRGSTTDKDTSAEHSQNRDDDTTMSE
ncbi:unnamed protein product [Zymoseptoria tritici ST99CH_1A5]|uniref:DNA repair protein Rad26 n=1 Tax=Zymoseptoria tritici ST99CH_1A5 TaxID=1276529 RepID=A0A1Y6LZY2_ZYMTR|nr:unnamed protein product [Zymoseptoria tritici ST99CH_1A5]